MQVRLLNNATPIEMEEIGRLRTLVWTGEEDVNLESLGPEPWIDEVDNLACQWTVHNDNQLVASARLTVHSGLELIPYHSAFQDRLHLLGPYGAMNRLVVHPNYRGQGFARLLDSLRLRHAPRIGAALVVVVASGRRVNALKALGFENLGLPCDTPDLLRNEQEYSVLVHHLKEIPNLPVLDWDEID